MILGHSILTNLERKIEKVPDDVRQALVTCPVGHSNGCRTSERSLKLGHGMPSGEIQSDQGDLD